uniref:Lipid droplet-associated hydrolase n=1 Tax=Ixodes ricinus TaxID=34613 RepID=A0A131Y1H3_IXORI
MEAGQVATKSKAHYDYIIVNDVPTKLLTIGKTSISARSQEPLFIFFPGNPGIIEYYEEFLQEIYDNLEGKLHVCGLAHAGHDVLPRNLRAPPPNENWHLYGLEGQVAHKVDFVKTHVSNDRPVFLAGHSIGAYMVLQMLKQRKELNVKRSFLLFPVFERLAQTPNAKALVLSSLLLKLATWLLVALLFVLPEFVKAALIEWHFKDIQPSMRNRIKKATLTLFTPAIFKLMVNMAEDELDQVKQRDEGTIRDNLKRLTFYYGSEDNWCPIEYFRDMRRAFPDADLNLCEHNLKHAFTLHSTCEMSAFVSGRVKDSLP